MTVFSIFTLLGGLAFFIYGMNQMSHSLEKIAGARMRNVIDKMTKNRILGLFLGCFITIAMQSSSAVTVMLVGLVNSGIMDISNTVAVIMGSNIGTTITAWIMSLIGISSDNPFVKMLKPESFSPLLAFIGIGLIMLSKKTKNKDVGNSFVGFAILMYGMMIMSSSVAPLADSPVFSKLLVTFKNPVLGLLVGLIVTAVIQSSAASVGMLQALSMAGGMTYGMAIPIIMGQNIGTCATALLSSIGVNKNAKRVAAIHLSFNIIGTAFFMILYFTLHAIFDFSFVDNNINPVGIAMCHSIFNIATTVILLPFSKFLVKIATKAIKTEPEAKIAFIDERLFETPSIAVSECSSFSVEMCELTGMAVKKAVECLSAHNEELISEIAKAEGSIDMYEDRLGSYLVRLSGKG
ncbi:MAG: Na/Pi cotransporter family protein, partial [Butyrivibrio hungatei]|nr:Na/Pi cotransporter family protein [Butyrivibrio hungatei]